MKKYLLIATFAIFASCNVAYAQSASNRIYRPCASTTSPAKISVDVGGGMSILPCATKSIAFNNSVSNSEFAMLFTPSTSAGVFSVGDYTTTPLTYFQLDQATTTGTLSGGIVRFGDFSSGGAATRLTITDSTATFAFATTSNLGIFNLGGILNYQLNRTITAGGTVGARTIDKPAGTVNFAAAATSLVVTNSTVTTSSIIFTTMRTADTTCTFVKSVVPAAGSFTITLNAGCAAETSVGFLVTN